MNDQYKSLAFSGQSVFRDKGSRFIGLVAPVSSTGEIKLKLEEIRKEYYDARHHCFAYRLGHEGNEWRINDDGEPSGSAGKPIYGQLLSHGLSDVLAVVVRYFGGTKLGIPGLINAYRTVTQEAIAAAETVIKVVVQPVMLRYTYKDMNAVMKIIKDEKTEVVSSLFDEECSLSIRIRLSELEKLKQHFSLLQDVQWVEMPGLSGVNLLTTQ